MAGMSAPTIERPAVEQSSAVTVHMFTVLTPRGAIVCRSRAEDVALSYLTPGAVLLCDGVPFTPAPFTPTPEGSR
jgi:hypothetical protein